LAGWHLLEMSEISVAVPIGAATFLPITELISNNIITGSVDRGLRTCGSARFKAERDQQTHSLGSVETLWPDELVYLLG
jgi:hypothetical protein